MQMQGTRDHYLQAPYLRAKQGQRDQLESGRERRKFGKRKVWEARNLAEREEIRENHAIREGRSRESTKRKKHYPRESKVKKVVGLELRNTD